MNETKHEVKQWKAGPVREAIQAPVYLLPIREDGEIIAWVYNDGVARKLLALPDLLAALKALVADYRWSKGDISKVYAPEHPITAAVAAIAAATGGAS